MYKKSYLNLNSKPVLKLMFELKPNNVAPMTARRHHHTVHVYECVLISIPPFLTTRVHMSLQLRPMATWLPRLFSRFLAASFRWNVPSSYMTKNWKHLETPERVKAEREAQTFVKFRVLFSQGGEGGKSLICS